MIKPGMARWLAQPAGTGRAGLFAGMFLIAFALLSFEITTVRTINFVLGPGYIYFAIAIGMLGLSTAGSLLSVARPGRFAASRERLLFWACLAAAAVIVAAHLLAAGAKHDLNAVVEAAGRAKGLSGAVAAMAGYGLFTALRTGLVLSLPYFLIGAVLALVFATTNGRSYDRLYAADLAGAALGCVGAVIVMELTDYAFSVTVPAAAALAAAAAFSAGRGRGLALAGLGLAAATLLLPLSAWYAKAVEPPADPHYLTRDYKYQADAREIWRDWNSYTRIGAVERADTGGTYTVMSLGNGEGMAWLLPYGKPSPIARRHLPALAARLAGAPGTVLVLMAGAGADLMSLDQLSGGATRATGIELNDELVRGALNLDGYRLGDFLARDNVALRVAEGRVFLERDSGRYDVVLLSYSGATASYYAGIQGVTTQYLFTYEGLSAVFDRLKPGGHAVILQINKLRALGALRRYLKARHIAAPERSAVILFDPKANDRHWNGPWDNNPMLVKPDGWSDDEVARIEQNGAAIGLQIAYAPGRPPHADYGVYRRVMEADDYAAELAAIGRQAGSRYNIVTDDSPYYLDIFRTGRYFDPAFWSGLANPDGKYYEFLQGTRVIFVLTIIVIGMVLILAPLLLRDGPRRTARNGAHLVYFLCLGAGFMTLEIALMQKAALLFGNPALTISLVLAGIILFSGLGSLISSWSFARGAGFATVAGGVAVYAVLLHLALGPVLEAMLAWPLAAKIAGVSVLVAPGAMLMGHLFPQGLALAAGDDTALIPWAWGINGALGTAAAGFAPLLAQALGVKALFLIGGAFYVLILVLPPYRRARRAAEPALA